MGKRVDNTDVSEGMSLLPYDTSRRMTKGFLKSGAIYFIGIALPSSLYTIKLYVNRVNHIVVTLQLLIKFFF